MKLAFSFALVAVLVAGLAIMGHVDPVIGGGLGGFAYAMAVQTTYNPTMPIGAPGMIADMTTYDGDSLQCETAAGIGFGLAVSQGSDDNGCVLGGASAAVFRGLSVRDTTLIGATPDEYQQNDTVAVMFRGDMWVTVGGDVTKGNDVTFNSTTGVLSSAATSGTQFAIPNARWLTSATSGNLAKVRLAGAAQSA